MRPKMPIIARRPLFTSARSAFSLRSGVIFEVKPGERGEEERGKRGEERDEDEACAVSETRPKAYRTGPTG